MVVKTSVGSIRMFLSYEGGHGIRSRLWVLIQAWGTWPSARPVQASNLSSWGVNQLTWGTKHRKCLGSSWLLLSSLASAAEGLGREAASETPVSLLPKKQKYYTDRPLVSYLKHPHSLLGMSPTDVAIVMGTLQFPGPGIKAFLEYSTSEAQTRGQDHA